MRKFFTLALVCLMSELFAQTVLENNPSSLDWYQVNTPGFRVLFPKGFETQAQRVANTLEHIRDAEAKSLGSSPKKISIILQNQSSTSNGFVSMFPRRSEFYIMPSQDYNFLGTNDWLDLLAAHEYRHVVQYQHATRGFNKLAFYLFGYAGLAGIAQASAPAWFWEGDAVATETAFTHSGRGRIPNFGLVFRTNLMEGRTFNYHKQYLRSYKHFIPDHYVLGYHMVSYLRQKTNDPDIWGRITARSWNMPLNIFSFSKAIRKETGMGVMELYNDMATNLKQEWKNEIDQLHLTSFEKVNPRNTKAYTDYLYPQPMDDGTVLALKRGIGDIAQFVLLKDGNEKKIFTPGFINDTGMLSAGFTAVLWNEYGYDPRWLVKNYSLIKLYDYKTNEKRVIGNKHSRYASAALAPTGEKVVTVRTNSEYKHNLVVVDVFYGKEIQEFENPENHFYAMPRWSEDGKRIVVLKTTRAGRTISSIDAATGEQHDLIPVSQENVGHPVPAGKYILFNSPLSGIDNIYALDTASGVRYQLTSSKYGAYNPGLSRDGKFLYYNDQAKDGMDVVRIPFDPSLWKPVVVQPQTSTLVQHLVEQEGRPHLFDSIPDTKRDVMKYSKINGLINPYSWGVVIDSDNLTRTTIGISSRDILSTTNITAGYTYDLTERTGMWRAGVSYQGWYPILDVNFSQGKRRVDEGTLPTLVVEGTDSTVVSSDVVFNWDERQVEAGLRIPLTLTNSKYATNLTVGNAVGVTQVSNLTNGVTADRYFPSVIVDDTIRYIYPFFDYVGNGNLVYNHFSLSAYRLLKRSQRDINSKWGQAIYLNYYSTPYGGDFQGGLASFLGYLYLPGFFKHHSIYGYWAYQQTIVHEELDDYIFRNTVPTPRGLSISRFEKLYTMSANYTMPLWYPDVSIGPLLNIQRVRLNAFADYAAGESSIYGQQNGDYFSVGGELKFDINILRFLPQLDIGVRYAHGIKPSDSRFEILIGSFKY